MFVHVVKFDGIRGLYSGVHNLKPPKDIWTGANQPSLNSALS